MFTRIIRRHYLYGATAFSTPTFDITTLHYDTQHYDTQHYDTQHYDTQHYDTQHYDTQHYDTQHSDTQKSTNVTHNKILIRECYTQQMMLDVYTECLLCCVSQLCLID